MQQRKVHPGTQMFLDFSYQQVIIKKRKFVAKYSIIAHPGTAKPSLIGWTRIYLHFKREVTVRIWLYGKIFLFVCYLRYLR